MIKAILFDLDGTLINTNPLIIRSFKETFQTYFPDRIFSDEEIYDCIGPTLEQTFTKYNKDNMLEMVNAYRTINMSYHDDMVEIYPSIQLMLQTLRDMGIKLAIVTSKKRDMALRGATLMNIIEYFDVVISADEVSQPKPEPDGILLATNALNLNLDEVMMVGDNEHDIMCAKNANVLSVGVSWALRGANYLQTFNPDYMLEDAMDLVEIVKNLNEV